jgi:hypothetical protein
MKRLSQCFHLLGLLGLLGLAGLLLVMAGCSYQAALQRLSPEERSEFAAYRRVMTTSQTHAYLAQETPAARAAYLRDIGLAQRFEDLEPLDRNAVLSGYIRQGMSAEALRFLWGDPYYIKGPRGHYEYWQYLGSTFELADRGNSYTAGTVVTVYLVDNKVEWWREIIPSDNDAGDKGDIIRR